MGFLKGIFSSKSLVEKISSGVDKTFFTKEEKADYFERLLKLYEPYKLAQRILATMFSGCYLVIHLLTGITHFIYTIREKKTEPIMELYKYNNEALGTIVLLIIGFYFAGGVLEGSISKFKKK